MLALVADEAPTGMILCAGAGSFEAAHITMTRGVYLGTGEDAGDQVLAALGRIADRDGEIVVETGMQQPAYELEQAGVVRTAPLAAHG
jgi:hypothetical protein